MISRITGKVLEIGLTQIVVDVSGIGYQIKVSPSITEGLTSGHSIDLFTSMVVREDSWTLYGFKTKEARELFEEVQTVSGIGPKVAHSLLSSLDPDSLRDAIGAGDQAALEKVPGIGKKVASRIMLELRDRYSNGKSRHQKSGKWRDSLEQALTSLGYSAKEAERIIDATVKDLNKPVNEYELADLLKRALASARSK